MNNFQKVKNESSKANESNDCAVKAIAIACNVPYKVAHKALANLGRRNRRGTLNSTIHTAIKQLGFELECITFKVKAKTVTTLAADRAVKDGFFVAFVRGHIAAIVNGQIEDWTEGKRHRIRLVYKVTPNKSRAERKAIMANLFA